MYYLFDRIICLILNKLSIQFFYNLTLNRLWIILQFIS